MAFELALRCRECAREYPLAPIFSCEFCFGPLEVKYDYDAIREATTRDSIEAGPATIWRYASFLPCDPEYKVDLGTGFTPLIKADRLAKALGLEQGKVVGSAIYAPNLVMVDGNYDEVNRLCAELASNRPWAFVNINMRSYYAEGSRTLSYEVAEQLGWRAPQRCVAPMASGA